MKAIKIELFITYWSAGDTMETRNTCHALKHESWINCTILSTATMVFHSKYIKPESMLWQSLFVCLVLLSLYHFYLVLSWLQLFPLAPPLSPVNHSFIHIKHTSHKLTAKGTVWTTVHRLTLSPSGPCGPAVPSAPRRPIPPCGPWWPLNPVGPREPCFPIFPGAPWTVEWRWRDMVDIHCWFGSNISCVFHNIDYGSISQKLRMLPTVLTKATCNFTMNEDTTLAFTVYCIGNKEKMHSEQINIFS